MNRKRIEEIVSEELESGTNALVEDEIEALSKAIAARLVHEIEEAYDDGDGDGDGRLHRLDRLGRIDRILGDY